MGTVRRELWTMTDITLIGYQAKQLTQSTLRQKSIME